MENEDNRNARPALPSFPTTLWTVVLEASSGDSPKAERALTKLCEMYRDPILVWLLRRGYSHHDAQDFVQQFMLHLLERNRFAHFVRTQTKFRSFLLECLKRFLRDEWKKQVAEKRGGLIQHLNTEDQNVGQAPEIDGALDTEFALMVHQTTMAKLEERLRAARRSERFTELSRYLFGSDNKVPYTDVAARLGITENAVKKAVFDLRDEYCDRFRDEVLQTVSLDAIDEEMRYLLALLARADDPRLTEINRR